MSGSTYKSVKNFMMQGRTLRTLEGPSNNNLKTFRVLFIKKLAPILMQEVQCTVFD
jgi:hypothetical protein